MPFEKFHRREGRAKDGSEAVSTIIRILETKYFGGHEEFGKSNRYIPLENKKEYSKIPYE